MVWKAEAGLRKKEGSPMFGFVIGTVCLVGLIAVLRRGRRWGHHHGPWRRGFGGGPRWYLRRAFGWLGTSPSQEKVIVGAAEELHASLHEARSEVFNTRGDLALALRKPSFDAEAMGEVFARHDEALRRLRETVVGAVARVHDALDEKQRAQLADMLERGGRRGYRGRSPYRGSLSL